MNAGSTQGGAGGHYAGRIASGAALAEALDAGLPVLVFGGPYSNLQATVAIREIAGGLGIPAAHVVCTGDVVAYCGSPNETCAVIREWGCFVIAGNCEDQLAARAEDCGCGFGDGTACDLLSRGWYAFADRVLEDDHRAWMGGLPRMLRFDALGFKWAVIHGGVFETSRYVFPSSPVADKAGEMAGADADVVIAGHCGLPFVQQIGARGLWLNAGVIGMPANDGTPDGWYGLIVKTADGLAVSMHRLAYDVGAAAVAAKAAAPAYAESLITGRWPSLEVLPGAERLSAGSPLTETRLIVEIG